MKILEKEYSIEKKVRNGEDVYVLNMIVCTDTGYCIKGKPFRTRKECTELISKLKGVIKWSMI